MKKHISCGFDLRLRVNLQEQNPDQADQFLVPQNWNPISADPWVWVRADEVANFMMKNPVSYPLGLMKDLNELLTALHERNIATVDQLPVCLTISEVTAKRFYNHFGIDYFKSVPIDTHLRSSGWDFCGFDTVELNGLTSGLKGIGYKEPSWSQLRAQFGSDLNEVGLFNDETIASQFAEVRGLQVPTHAPLDVVGILVHGPLTR